MMTELFRDCWEDCCYADDTGVCLINARDGHYPSTEINGVNYFGRLDYTFFTLFMVSIMIILSFLVVCFVANIKSIPHS